MVDDSEPPSTAAVRSEDDPTLAVVVEKNRTSLVLEALRAEGIYDDSRRIREFDSETTAIPVTASPTKTSVREVITQIDPAYRHRDVEDHLSARGWSDDDLSTVPRSWAVVGSVILVTVPADCPDETALGEALLDVHGEADSVLADEGIATVGNAGRHREPRTRLLAGSRDTETIHTEHGTQYALDPARVMFSPGNVAERVRMGEIVDHGERVFDMFAGVGYFTLPMARRGAQVTATEINPVAFRYLLENAVLNDVDDRIDAYRDDCRRVGPTVTADRVVMGYYGYRGETDGRGTDRVEDSYSYLPVALQALRSGGTLHVHAATPNSQLWNTPIDRLTTAVDEIPGRGPVDVVEKRRVKSYSPGVSHVVLDVVVE